MNKVIIFLFFILSLIYSSYSSNIEILGNIDEYSSIYTEIISINLNCGEEIKFQVSSDMLNLDFNNKTIEDNEILINDCSKVNILKYNLNNIEELKNNTFRFERNYINLKNLNYTYSLKIPLEYFIIKETSFPNNYSINYFDTYKLITFKKNDFYVLYFYDNLNLEDKKISLLHLEDELSEFTVLFLILISFSLGFFISYILFKMKLKESKLNSVPSFVLNQDEKLIYDVIKNNQGINQKQIAIKINFSKVKVSIIVNDLEQKDLIKREKFGRSFKVYTKKNLT